MEHIKYPRTQHLPWSQGATDDDKVLKSVSHFEGRRVVVTMKMDGENTTFYRDGYLHARSLDSRGGEDRDWVKRLAQTVGYQLPEGWRVCGENLWARHSISYDDLPSYFMGFSIWNEHNVCLNWEDTKEWFEILGIKLVPIMDDGLFDVNHLQELVKRLDPRKDEGYVIRLADKFKYEDFGTSVAKFVRANHVQTDTHWRHSQIVPNELAK